MAGLSDEDVGLVAARPAVLSDEDVGLAPPARSPIASQFGGTPGMPEGVNPGMLMAPEPEPAPQAPANAFAPPESVMPPPVSIADRFKANVREGFDNTSTGEVINRVQSGQVDQTAADNMFRAIVEARQANSPVGLDIYQPTATDKASKFPGLHQPEPSPYAGVPLSKLEADFNAASKTAQAKSEEFGAKREGQRAEYEALPSFADAPTLKDKAIQGAVALAGQLVGGAAGPENLIGGPGKGLVREAGENIIKRAAREALPGAIAGASGGAVAAPAVMSSKAERGEGDGLTGENLGEQVALGAAVGAVFHLPGILARPILERIAARRGVPIDKLDPGHVSQTEVTETFKDPEIAALAKANGIESPTDARVPVLEQKLAARRGEEALRTPDQPGGPLKAQDAEMLRRQQEKAGVESETINPAATNLAARTPDQTPIRVDREGNAFRADAGALEGKAKAEVLQRADMKLLPAPEDRTGTREGQLDSPNAEGINVQRRGTQADRPHGGFEDVNPEPPPKLYGGENRPPEAADGRALVDYANQKTSTKAADPVEGKLATDPNGYVASDKGGPVRFAQEKQAERFAASQGKKTGQDFEVVEHPAGKGFTVQERAPEAQAPRQIEDMRDGQPARGEAQAAPGETAPRQIEDGRSYDEKVSAERDRLWADEMSGYAKDGSLNKDGTASQAVANHGMVDASARETVMRQEAAEPIKASRVTPDEVHDISQHYRRAPDETPQQAWDRAIDRWSDKLEADAMRHENGMTAEDDAYMAEHGLDSNEHLYTDNHEAIHGPEVNHDEIPFDGHDRGAGEPHGADSGAAEGERAGRSGGDEARGQAEHGSKVAEGHTDAGPDGKRQTVIPGAERLTDRALAERQGNKPLRGGDEPPPKGGLFDEDARNQKDMFDQKSAKPVEVTDDLKKLANQITNKSEFRHDLREDAGGVIVGALRRVDHEIERGSYSLSDLARDFEPVRDYLREKYGDHVTLYRADAPLSERNAKTRTVLMGDEKLARRFAQNGREAKPYVVPVDDIVALHATDSGYYEFVVKKPSERSAGFDPTRTMHAGAIFDPAVWKWFGSKMLGEKYLREMRGLAKDLKEDRADTRGRKTSKAADAARFVFYSVDGQMRALADAIKSPTLKKIADLFYAPADVGRGGAVGQTYHEAVTAQSGRNLNRLAAIMEKLGDKPAAFEQVVKLVQNPRNIKPGTAVHDAAAAIAKLLADEHAYLKAAGIEVGKVEGYYPREINVASVMKNGDGFRLAAERAYKASGLSAQEAKEAAEQWLSRVVLGGVNVRPEGTDFVHMGGTPSSKFSKGRELSKAADEIMAPFYHRDPLEALTTYFQRTARRAEWARRMGDYVKGPDGKPVFDELGKWKQMKAEMIKEGNAAAVRQTVDMIASSTGANAATLPMGADSLIGVLKAYGTVKLLTHAAITSASESVLPAIRAGAPHRILTDIPRTVAALFAKSGKLGEQRAFAEDLGLIMRGAANGILAARYSALDPTSRIRERIMNRNFRMSGLEQWTSATRVMAVHGAETFVRRLALDVADGRLRQASSRNLLAELGVKDVAGFSRWVKDNDGALKGRDATAGGHSDTYRNAVTRFVHQSIMEVSASTRPQWANNPVGSLIFMLQSYNYAYQKNVTSRAYHQVASAFSSKGGNLADRATMLSPLALIPAMFAIQMGLAPVRNAVFNSAHSKPLSDDDQLIHNMTQAASRSVTGAFDPIVNLFTSAKYHSSSENTLGGPVAAGIGQLIDAVVAMTPKDMGGPNSDKTNSAERNLTRNIYDSAVAPAIVTAGALSPSWLGALLTQAPSLGPVKDAVIDSVAGAPTTQGSGRPQRPQRPQRPHH